MTGPHRADGSAGSAPAGRPLGLLVGVAVVAYAVAGVAAGLLWRAWAEPERYDVRRSVGYPQGVDPSPAFGNDLRFAALGLVLGLLVSGVLAVGWRRQGPVLVAVTGLGALGAGLLAWGAGVVGQPGPVPEQLVDAADGSVLTAPLELLAPSLLVAWPAAAMVAVLLVVMVSDRPGPGRRWADGPPAEDPTTPGWLAGPPAADPAEPASGGPRDR